MFIVYVACDIDGKKHNTAIEYDEIPADLCEIVEVAEALYSAQMEARLTTGPSIVSSPRKFRCVACLAWKEGQWVEVRSMTQITHRDQLFMFDVNAPPPSTAAVPKAPYAVRASEVLKALSSQSLKSASSPAALPPVVERLNDKERYQTTSAAPSHCAQHCC